MLSTVNRNVSSFARMSTKPGLPISSAFFRHSPSYAYESGASISTFRVLSLYLNTGAGDDSTNAIFSSSVSVAMRSSLIVISGSNLYVAVATGCHLAWSRPTPLRATHRMLISWFLRSLRMRMGFLSPSTGTPSAGAPDAVASPKARLDGR